MVGRKYLFIEGTTDISNGDLREGFRKLLEKEATGKMPTISMGDGKSQTISKFRNSKDSKILCDLDGEESTIAADLTKYDLTQSKDFVFYMIHEMEGWFLSQPDILDSFYNYDVSGKLTKKKGCLFANPDKELQRVTKDCKKGPYHKVAHGAELLKLLNTKKLKDEFPDFKRLLDSL